MPATRRNLLRALGAGAAAIAAAPLLRPTDASGDLGPSARFAAEGGAAALPPTEDNILGPYWRPGALFRAKVCPPLAAGAVLVVGGRVVGTDGAALGGAVLDIWHADHEGRYDNDDPARPPGETMINRARIVTDERGRYEFETIMPGAYRLGPQTWRPRHVHYRVRAAGRRELITQLYFRGEAHNDTDAFIKPSLIIDLREERGAGGPYRRGAFDIVLARA